MVSPGRLAGAGTAEERTRILIQRETDGREALLRNSPDSDALAVPRRCPGRRRIDHQ